MNIEMNKDKKALIIGFANNKNIKRITKKRRDELGVIMGRTINTNRQFIDALRFKQDGRRKTGIKGRKKLTLPPVDNLDDNEENDIEWFNKQLWKHRGTTIRANYKSKNNEIKSKIYDVPSTKKVFDIWKEQKYLDFWTYDGDDDSYHGSKQAADGTYFHDALHAGDDDDYDDDDYTAGAWGFMGRHAGGTFHITTDTGLSDELHNQILNDTGGCFSNPIIEWADTHMKTKKQKKRYGHIKNKLKKVQQEFNGIPENMLLELARKLKLKFIIYPPFIVENNRKNLKHAKIYNCIGKPIKVFTYFNTKENHVECNLPLPKIDYLEDKAAMSKKYNQFKEEFKTTNIPFQYKQYSNYITEIIRGKNIYRIEGDYDDREILNKFEDELNKNQTYRLISVNKNPHLSKYLKQSCRYMGCVDVEKDWINFKIKQPKYHYRKNLQHIDIKRGYTQYKKTKFYEGFVGKFHEFRETNKICGVGIYTITNLTFNTYFALWLNEYMGIFGDYVSYPSPLLKLFKSFGIGFTIVCGCWGSKVDFEFTKEMLETKNTANIPLYSYFTGKSDKQDTDVSFKLYGSKTHHTSLHKSHKSLHPENRSYFFEDKDGNGVGTYYYKMSDKFHNSGFTSFILAYQACNVITQLHDLLFDKDYHNRILRVCGDGIYYTGKRYGDGVKGDTPLLCGGFRNGKDMKFGNVAGENYFSGLDNSLYIKDDLEKTPKLNNGFYLEEAEEMKNKIIKLKNKPEKIVKEKREWWYFKKLRLNTLKKHFNELKKYKNPINILKHKYKLGKIRETFDKSLIKLGVKGGRSSPLIEAHYGPAGCGKTTTLLTMGGFINAAFITNGWLLSYNKAQEYYNLHAEVNNVFISKNVKRRLAFLRDYNVIIVDEGSMVDKILFKIMKDVCKEWNIKLIFCGDWKYQLGPPHNESPEMSLDNLHIFNYTYEKGKCRFENKEFEADGIVPLVYKLRNQIDICKKNKHKHYCNCGKNAIKYIHNWGTTISRDDCIKIYEKEDRIICKTNIRANFYTKLLKTDDINRYKINGRVNGKYTGDVVFGTAQEIAELYGDKILLKYADTIHSLQGITAKSRVFIDMYTMPLKEIMTAITRVRSKDDLYFII